MIDVDDLIKRSRTSPEEVVSESLIELSDGHNSVSYLVGIRAALAWAYFQLGRYESASIVVHEAMASTAPNSAVSDYLSDLTRIDAFINRMNGNAPEAIDILLRGLTHSSGEARSRLFSTLGAIHSEVGDLEKARAAYAEALSIAREVNSETAELEVLNNQAVTNLMVGDLFNAEKDLRIGLRLGRSAGPRQHAVFLQNLGVVAIRTGRLSQAVTFLRRCLDVSKTVGDPSTIGEMLLDQVELYLDAGMLDEALIAAEQAGDVFDQLETPIRRLHVRLLAVRILANGGRWAEATEHGERALVEAESISDDPLHQQATDLLESVRVIAAAEAGAIGEAQESFASIESLAQHPDLAVDAAFALLRADRFDEAIRILEIGQKGARVSSLTDLHVAVANATLAYLASGPKSALDKIESAMVVADQTAAQLGVSELRATTNRRVRQLASLGIEIEIGRKNPSGVVAVLERERSITLAAEPALTSEERQVVDQLRETGKQLRDVELDSEEERALQDRRRELEVDLRNRRLTNSSSTDREWRDAFVGARVPSVHLFVSNGALRGAITDAEDSSLLVNEMDLKSLRRGLNALQTNLTMHAGGAGIPLGRLLGGISKILRPLLAEIDRLGSVVVIPDPTLEHIPWALFTSSIVVQCSSYAEWVQSTAHRLDSSGRSADSAIIAGPRLEHAKEEAGRIASILPNARVLTGSDANAKDVLDAFGSVGTVHFATHGHFRSDNPLISSVELADGPLTFLDLLGTGSVPERIVFSACDVGRSSARSSLGLAALLIDRGCRGFIASSGAANDSASVELMERVHQRLIDGETMGPALAAAQAGMVEDEPSVALFSAYGAG